MIVDILMSSLTGNIIGLISLVLTIITMISALKIKKEVEREKVVAIERCKFLERRKGVLELIDSKLGAISDTDLISRKMCIDIMDLLEQILTYRKVISKEDQDYIEACRKKIKEMANKSQNSKNDVTEAVEMLQKVKSILNKGEYTV